MVPHGVNPADTLSFEGGGGGGGGRRLKGGSNYLLPGKRWQCADC